MEMSIGDNLELEEDMSIEPPHTEESPSSPIKNQDSDISNQKKNIKNNQRRPPQF